jgi:hypothetical protein
MTTTKHIFELVDNTTGSPSGGGASSPGGSPKGGGDGGEGRNVPGGRSRWPDRSREPGDSTPRSGRATRFDPVTPGFATGKAGGTTAFHHGVPGRFGTNRRTKFKGDKERFNEFNLSQAISGRFSAKGLSGSSAHHIIRGAGAATASDAAKAARAGTAATRRLTRIAGLVGNAGIQVAGLGKTARAAGLFISRLAGSMAGVSLTPGVLAAGAGAAGVLAAGAVMLGTNRMANNLAPLIPQIIANQHAQSIRRFNRDFRIAQEHGPALATVQKDFSNLSYGTSSLWGAAKVGYAEFRQQGEEGQTLGGALAVPIGLYAFFREAAAAGEGAKLADVSGQNLLTNEAIGFIPTYAPPLPDAPMPPEMLPGSGATQISTPTFTLQPPQSP